MPEGTFGVGRGSSYALEVGWRLSEQLDASLRWQQVFGALDLEDRSVSDTELDLNALTAGLRWAPCARPRRVQPWIGAQAGWYRARGVVEQFFAGIPATGEPAVESSETRSGDTIGANAALGVDIQITERVSFDFELRYHYTPQLSFLTPLVGITIRFNP